MTKAFLMTYMRPLTPHAQRVIREALEADQRAYLEGYIARLQALVRARQGFL